VAILKTEIDVKDFVRGCTFMGTGGGGPQQVGQRYLLEKIREGKSISWVDPNSIPDDALTCVPMFMGSIAPAVPETKIKMQERGLVDVVIDRELVIAVEEMKNYLGVDKFDAIVPFELGGINTPAPVDAAVHLGIPVVDGDYCGRALPEMCQATTVLYGYKLEPVVSVDRWGNVLTINKAVNNAMVEALGKSASTTAFVIVGQCAMVLKGSEMKKAIIPGTLTKCFEIGKCIREAREQGKNPVREVVNNFDGHLLFEGVVTDKTWEDRDGYLFGYTTIKGERDYANDTYKIWYKNENHITWLNGELDVLSPDLIIVVDSTTGEPITNTDLVEGMDISVIGMRCDDQYRTPEGIDLVGPKHYGFDIEFTPIEDVLTSRKR
jgi:DUF917 family protein